MKIKYVTILLLLFILCGCKGFKITGLDDAIKSSEQVLTNLSKNGYLEDDVYYYPDLNIKFDIPNELRLLSNREINVLVYGSTEQPPETSERVVHEFFALDMDDSSNISLTSEVASGDINIDDYANNFYNAISANSEAQNTEVYQPEKFKICGNEFIKISSTIKNNGRCIDTYIINTDDKFVSIQIMCNSKEEIDKYLSIIHPIE